MNVAELRSALLETPDRATVVETVIRRYNHWLAEVRDGVVAYQKKKPALTKLLSLKKE